MDLDNDNLIRKLLQLVEDEGLEDRPSAIDTAVRCLLELAESIKLATVSLASAIDAADGSVDQEAALVQVHEQAVFAEEVCRDLAAVTREFC